MLKLMRNQKFIKSLMWIIIIAFVAWLGIELGYGGGPRGANPAVGDVDGEAITFTNFRTQIARLQDLQRREDETQAPDEFDLEEQVWQQDVRAILLRKAIARMRITVTPDEVAQALVDNPPRGFDQVPDFQRPGGGFDRDKYRQFIATMTDARWYQITGMTFSDYENQLRFEIAVQKLRAQIADAGWVTEAMLKQAYGDQNETATLQVIAAPISHVPESKVSVTGGEVREYYQTHLGEFKRPARAQLNYVLIPKVPSRQDSVFALTKIRDIKRRLDQGADFGDMAREQSEDAASARDDGKLGTFARGTMVPEFDAVAFSLAPGQISDPVHTQFGWHIIKVDRHVRGATAAQDSVQAEHILIRDDQPGAATLDSLTRIAEQLHRAGPSFMSRARQLGFTPETTPWFSLDVVFPIPGVQETVRRLVRWAFVGEVGSETSPATTAHYVVAAQLAARTKAGPLPLDQVQDGIRAKLALGERVAMAAATLAPIAQKIAQGQSMEQAVAGTGLQVIQVGPFTRSQYLPEVEAGAWDGFVGAAFALRQPGQTTGVLSIDERGAYIMRLVSRTLDRSGFASQRDVIRSRLVRQEQQALFGDWESYTRASARIKDYRDRFYSYD